MIPAPVLALLIAEAPTLIADVTALFKKHPALTPETLGSLAAGVYAANADTRAVIAADQTGPTT